MFDPTAFDNMKVIIEGAFYDLDLNGMIQITDRNDWINTAKMSRLFTVSFCMPGESRVGMARMELESGLENLAAELLPGAQSEKLAGCYVKVQYTLEHQNSMELFNQIQSVLAQNWGNSRKIRQAVEYDPFFPSGTIKNTITIDFQRLVSEAQLEDLVEMVEVLMTTLQELHRLISQTR